MTGKRYYISTIADWQRHTSRFANSHWFALASRDEHEPQSGTGDSTQKSATPILVLVEADEGGHLALEDDPAFEPLPHPLAQEQISAAAQRALAWCGISPGATTFDVAETMARFHPLLRHRVF